jgi:uncharacterized protein (TIGR02594 family)
MAMPLVGNQVASSPAMPAHLAIAYGEVGVTEIRGPEHNPRIVEYHQACDLHAGDDETPWCSAYVNWCFQQAGMPRTRSAMARSWLHWGVEIDEPELGCVAVMGRGGNPNLGHVGFAVQWDDDYVWLLAGNQKKASNSRSESVCVKKFPRSNFIGFRKARALAASTTIAASAATGAATATAEVANQVGPELPNAVEVITKPEVQQALSAAQVTTGLVKIACFAIVAFGIYWIVRERYKKWKQNAQ